MESREEGRTKNIFFKKFKNMLKFAVLALFLIVTSSSAEETTSKKGIAEWGRQMKTAIEGLAQDAKQAAARSRERTYFLSDFELTSLQNKLAYYIYVYIYLLSVSSYSLTSSQAHSQAIMHTYVTGGGRGGRFEDTEYAIRHFDMLPKIEGEPTEFLKAYTRRVRDKIDPKKGTDVKEECEQGGGGSSTSTRTLFNPPALRVSEVTSKTKTSTTSQSAALFPEGGRQRREVTRITPMVGGSRSVDPFTSAWEIILIQITA